MSRPAKTVRVVVGSMLAVALVQRVMLDRKHPSPASALPSRHDGGVQQTWGGHHEPPTEPSAADWKLARYSLRSDARIAVALALVVFAATWWLENRMVERAELAEEGMAERAELAEERMAERAEIAENVRFVRQVAIQVAIDDGADVKPFRGLNLRKADLAGLNLRCARPGYVGCLDFSHANLSDANLSGAMLIGADLTGADLGDADLIGAELSDADLRDASLLNAGLRHAYLRDAYLGHADLRGADLIGADLGHANLRDAYLRDAELRGAYLGDANLRGADLTGANLRSADLTDAQLLGVCDDSTSWPHGFTPPAETYCEG